MAITPDGSGLLVANKQDASIAIINPDLPVLAQSPLVITLSFRRLGTLLLIFDTQHGNLLQSIPPPDQANVAAKVIALDSYW